MNDILLWPDGTTCFAYELHEYSHMSDDYERVAFGTSRWYELAEVTP